MMTCSVCQSFSYISIKTPTELTEAISALQKAVRKGDMQSLGTTYQTAPLKELAHNHWNDSVSNYLMCSNCHQYFHLSAETYHGSGGSLSTVETLPDSIAPD
ncbi:MAG: hypothetical protein ACRCWR_03320 [Saezia sp.]